MTAQEHNKKQGSYKNWGHSELAARRVFIIYCLGSWSFIKIKVILEGFCPVSVVFLFLSNNRSWTTTFQDGGNNNTKDKLHNR